MLLLCAFLASVSGYALQSVRYDGYKVYTLDPSTILGNQTRHQHIHKLNDMDRMDVNFWDGTDMMVSPFMHDKVLAELDHLGIKYTLHTEDVQSHLEESMLSFQSGVDADYFDAYHPWEEILEYTEGLVNQYNGQGELNAKIEDYDIKTYEGNTIKRVLLTGKGGYSTDKKFMYIEATIHAREWIGTTSLQYVLTQLLELYGQDAAVTEMVDKFIWVIVPVVNVDGYIYSWTTDRMWRKTRTPQGFCTGVDPNRNWNNHWCEAGASSQPCSDSYCGPSAFSELCVTAVKTWIEQNAERVFYFGDLHTYGSMVFGPYGWTCSQVPNEFDKQKAGFQPMVDELIRVSGTRWKGYGSICNTIYAASGSSVDWGYDQGVPFPFGAELMGNSFAPPAQRIRSYAESWWAGIKVMGKTALTFI